MQSVQCMSSLLVMAIANLSARFRDLTNSQKCKTEEYGGITSQAKPYSNDVADMAAQKEAKTEENINDLSISVFLCIC